MTKPDHPKETPDAGRRAGAQTQDSTVKPNASSPAVQSTRRPWREALKSYPAADLFPLMNAGDLRALADDIKKNGLREKVSYARVRRTVYILDGRNRLDALALLGVDVGLRKGVPDGRYCVPFERRVWPLSHDEVTAYIVSMNVQRRHLTAEQKRELIAKLLTLAPAKSDRAIAKTTGVSDKTVNVVRRDLEARSEIPNIAQRIDSIGRKQPVTVRVRIANKTTQFAVPLKQPATQPDPLPALLPDKLMQEVFGQFDTEHVLQLILWAFRNRVPAIQCDKLIGQLEAIASNAASSEVH